MSLIHSTQVDSTAMVTARVRVAMAYQSASAPRSIVDANDLVDVLEPGCGVEAGVRAELQRAADDGEELGIDGDASLAGRWRWAQSCGRAAPFRCARVGR